MANSFLCTLLKLSPCQERYGPPFTLFGRVPSSQAAHTESAREKLMVPFSQLNNASHSHSRDKKTNIKKRSKWPQHCILSHKFIQGNHCTLQFNEME